MLPEALRAELHTHCERLRMLYEEDRRNGVPGVALPGALVAKYPQAGQEWGWQWVFPARGLSKDPRSGMVRRHHVQEDSLQRAVKQAARRCGMAKAATCHALRHSFATHLLEVGYDICRSRPRSRPSGSRRLAVSRRLRRSAAPCRSCWGIRTFRRP